MADPASSGLQPGQSLPLLTITDTDKGGVIVIVTALGIAISLVSLFIRAYVRYEFSPQRFGWDDFVVGIAFVSLPHIANTAPKLTVASLFQLHRAPYVSGK